MITKLDFCQLEFDFSSILVMDNKTDFLLMMILYVVHANYFAQEVQTRFSSNNHMNKQQGLLP